MSARRREIRMPDHEPIRDRRMALVVTETNEIIIDRVGLEDDKMAAILSTIPAQIHDRQG
jgi:hypothetical protein